jgi:hypothetical protein
VKRRHVSSSVLASVGYDDEAHMLELEFHSGEIYEYFDVPPHVHDELMAAESLGGYFARHIREQYPYERR